MTDKLSLQGMSFYGYHGALPAEKSLGQRFVIDVTLYLDLAAAGKTDSLEKSIDYTGVYNTVKQVVEEERFNLIEALAERIATLLLERYIQAKQVVVNVTKPQVPIAGVLAGAQVEISRRRLKRVYLSLGSNIEPKEEYLRQALRLIASHPRIKLIKTSSLYLTEPVGYREQDWFLNAVAACDTDLNPLLLLQEIQNFELLLQRQRQFRWGPRTIDIDIITYGEDKIDLPQLQIPHPRARQRAFVLVPLAELNREAIIEGKTVQELLDTLKATEQVKYHGPFNI
ncbi:MAG: 2-amino-4-hydroxy-6-hydroxymethyldihydropteridine diphosphokinase [Clostridia bacterium]|nr:2-amino-4-hydroxy-6-hydroxymethyldihydropteridine diphosphokinase [Clostridia bacterium]